MDVSHTEEAVDTICAEKSTDGSSSTCASLFWLTREEETMSPVSHSISPYPALSFRHLAIARPSSEETSCYANQYRGYLADFSLSQLKGAVSRQMRSHKADADVSPHFAQISLSLFLFEQKSTKSNVLPSLVSFRVADNTSAPVPIDGNDR